MLMVISLTASLLMGVVPLIQVSLTLHADVIIPDIIAIKANPLGKD